MLVATLHLALAMAATATPTTSRAPEAPASARAEVEPTAAPAVPEASAPLQGPMPPPEIPAPPEPEPEPLARPSTPVDAASMAEPPDPLVLRMVVTSGVLGGLGLACKIIGTSWAVRSARANDGNAQTTVPSAESDSPVGGDPVFIPPMLDRLPDIAAITLLTSSVVVLGTGMVVHGRGTARRDVANGRPYDRRKIGSMLGLGWGAVGLGAASLVTALTLEHDTHPRAIAAREIGTWTAIAAVFSGVGLASYGSGYRIARSELDRGPRARMAPMLSRQLVGVGISGGF